MAAAGKGIFREKSLERLSSPDRLDELLRVVRRRNWIPLLVLGTLLLLAAVWSFVGRIPVHAEGTAVLVHPRQVLAFQCPASGQLVDLHVRVGDRVETDQVLATLNLPELSKQLEQEQARFEEVCARDLTMTAFEREQAVKERAFLVEERRLIEERVASLSEMAESTLEKNRAYNAEQRVNLSTAQRLSKELGDSLTERFVSIEKLRADGLSSEDELVAARRRVIENQLAQAELDVKVQELELRKIQTAEAHQEQRDLIAGLGIELQQLSLKESQIERRLLEASLDSESRCQEIERNIARLKNQLETRGRITSELAGRILELTVSPGAYVTEGQRLGALEAEDPDAELLTLAYFRVADGKKIRPGMKARVAPDTVQRARHGSLLATVSGISDYPVTTEAAANQVGNRELAQALVAGGTKIEVFARLQPDPAAASGYRWTSADGPELAMTAGTTARIRVTIEERAPITFVLPILKAWLGGE